MYLNVSFLKFNSSKSPKQVNYKFESENISGEVKNKSIYSNLTSKMASCGICSRSFTSRQIVFKCCDCNKQFHGTCVGMSKAEYEAINSEGTVWRCEPCSVARRSSLQLQTQAAEGNLTLEDVITAINSLRGEQKNYITEFNASYELLNNKLDDNTKALREHTDKNAALMKVIEDQVAEIKYLKEKVNLLESKLDESEQYSRRNCVEIHGMPLKDGSVIDTVKVVGKSLDMDIQDSMIDACHVLGKKPDSGGHPSIIVKFVRRFDAETMLTRRRIKRQLSTRHMGLSSDSPVYINESLTPARRRLLAMAREIRSRKNYKWIWVRGGRIFLRKDDGGPVSIVKCQSDLDSL